MSKFKPRFVTLPGGVNGKASIPLVGQGHTIKRYDIIKAYVAPLKPGATVPVIMVELGFQRSDNQPVKMTLEIPADMSAADVIMAIRQAEHGLQTYLNCKCEPNVPCALHAVTPEAAAPTGIVLTDAGGNKKG